jgi:diaminopimelate decarboxylase
MSEKNPYIKIQGIEFHTSCKDMSLDMFKKIHKHLKIDLEKAHKKLQK